MANYNWTYSNLISLLAINDHDTYYFCLFKLWRIMNFLFIYLYSYTCGSVYFMDWTRTLWTEFFTAR